MYYILTTDYLFYSNIRIIYLKSILERRTIQSFLSMPLLSRVYIKELNLEHSKAQCSITMHFPHDSSFKAIKH